MLVRLLPAGVATVVGVARAAPTGRLLGRRFATSAPRWCRATSCSPFTLEPPNGSSSAPARSTGLDTSHPTSGEHSRHSAMSAKRIGPGGECTGSTSRVLPPQEDDAFCTDNDDSPRGPRSRSGEHANAFKPILADGNKTPPPEPSAARRRDTAHSHPGARRAAKVHTVGGGMGGGDRGRCGNGRGAAQSLRKEPGTSFLKVFVDLFFPATRLKGRRNKNTRVVSLYLIHQPLTLRSRRRRRDQRA